MFLNKKGWHKFMSICLCIAALCTTNKHSLLPLETRGRGNRKEKHQSMGLDSRASPKEGGSQVAFWGFQADTFVFADTPLSFQFSLLLTGAWGPQAVLRYPEPFCPPSPAVPWTLCPLTASPITDLSLCLSGHCSRIGANCNLTSQDDVDKNQG